MKNLTKKRVANLSDFEPIVPIKSFSQNKMKQIKIMTTYIASHLKTQRAHTLNINISNIQKKQKDGKKIYQMTVRNILFINKNKLVEPSDD